MLMMMMIVSWHYTAAVRRALLARGQSSRRGLRSFNVYALHWGQRPGVVITHSMLVLVLLLVLVLVLAASYARMLEAQGESFVR